MRFHAWQNLSDAYRARTTGHSPWPADLATEPEPELIPDVAGDARLDALRDVVIEEGIRALAFVPLFDDGRLIGKLMLYYDTVHTLLPLELIVARMLATQASFAIGRLRAQQRAEDAHAELMYWPSVIRTLGSEV
jgi:GAF domain-containing protein